ncbi:hypothetical protein HHI36_005748 [Cryptolaemus montrouzieri]|uniref:PDZ domain-containing protein n=1 Tax=Cryptolaemus montrouzieri TaxID=559131 RepID=A0ABD2NVA6_9CUCU
MFDCIVPDEVNGIAFITVGDLSSLVSIVADDVDGTKFMVADDVGGTGSMVADDVDGVGMTASDDVAVIGLTEVGFGSPADGVLQRGDIITKVGNYDARDIRHQDAQNLFKNSGNTVRIVVQRDTSQKHPTSTGSSRTSSHNYSPLSVSPHLSPRGPSSNYSPGASALNPYYSLPFTPLDNDYFEVLDYAPGSRKPNSDGEIHVTKQKLFTDNVTRVYHKEEVKC